ncbi:DUF481 domain-containing protein [Robbsia sp. KACC 23696]|uniref:DUF481 domain-containing protein n=1 Tax=Robbsia sp. KACC 23696 TaxID=3149231 RepID=UPI00325BE9E6
MMTAFSHRTAPRTARIGAPDAGAHDRVQRYAGIGLALLCLALPGRAARAELLDGGEKNAVVVAPREVTGRHDARWRGSVNGGLVGTAGDVRSFALTGDVDAQRSNGIDTITLNGLATRGLTRSLDGRSVQTANYQRGLLQYDRNLTDRIYGLGYLELERAPLRGLSVRTTFGVGAGYHLIRDERKTFDVFGGVGYTVERYAASNNRPGETIKSPELMLGERFTYQFSERSRFEQRFVVYPSIGPFGRVRTQLELALSTALSDRLQMKVSLLNIYRSHPRANNSKMNTMLMTSLGYTFGK